MVGAVVLSWITIGFMGATLMHSQKSFPICAQLLCETLTCEEEFA